MLDESIMISDIVLKDDDLPTLYVFDTQIDDKPDTVVERWLHTRPMALY